MPCAPASSAIRARPTTLGIASGRWLRSSAILLTLTESAVAVAAPVLAGGDEGIHRFGAALRFDHDLARAQLRSAEMIVKLRAQQRPQRGERAGGDPLQRRQVGRPSAASSAASVAPLTVAVVLVVGLDDAGVGEDEVAPLGAHRPVRRRLGAEVGQQADLAQQHELERAQRRLRRGLVAVAERGDRAGVGVEERRVRVVAGEQLHQQLVQVEAAEERRAGQHRMAAGPVGGAQRVHLARVVAGRLAAERDLQALERQQHAAQLRERPLGALGGDGDPALLAREQVEDEARLAPVVVVQHVRRQRGAAAGAARHVSAGARGRAPPAAIHSRTSADALRRRPSRSSP